MILNNLGGQTNSNYGGRINFEIGTWGGVSTARHALMRFDLTSMAGQFSTITGVTLRLTFSNAAGNLTSTSSNTIEVHQIAAANAGWIAGIHDDNGGPDGEPTWNYRAAFGVGWAGSGGASSPGTDFLIPAIASTAWSGARTDGTTFDLVFNDTSFLTYWINGTNWGLFLMNSAEAAAGDNTSSFYSSDFGTVGVRPELIVSYTAIPEPALNAALLACAVLGFARRRPRSFAHHR
jgi:hypothetical protein